MFFVMEHDMMLFATTESVKRISSLDMGTIMVKWLVANICILNILLEMCWYLKIQETNIVIDYNIIFQRLFYDVVAPPPVYETSPWFRKIYQCKIKWVVILLNVYFFRQERDKTYVYERRVRDTVHGTLKTDFSCTLRL